MDNDGTEELYAAVQLTNEGETEQPEWNIPNPPEGHEDHSRKHEVGELIVNPRWMLLAKFIRINMKQEHLAMNHEETDNRASFAGPPKGRKTIA